MIRHSKHQQQHRTLPPCWITCRYAVTSKADLLVHNLLAHIASRRVLDARTGRCVGSVLIVEVYGRFKKIAVRYQRTKRKMLALYLSFDEWSHNLSFATRHTSGHEVGAALAMQLVNRQRLTYACCAVSLGSIDSVRNSCNSALQPTLDPTSMVD